MARVKREGQERDEDDSDSDESTDEDFNPEVQESDVAEEYVSYILQFLNILLCIHFILDLIVIHQQQSLSLEMKKEAMKRKTKRRRIKNLKLLRLL